MSLKKKLGATILNNDGFMARCQKIYRKNFNGVDKMISTINIEGIVSISEV